MSDQQLTVAALRTTVEAELIRSKLEKAGIASVLLEPAEQPGGAPAARVQVQVGPADFERAMQLLFPIPQRPRPAKIDAPGWKCPQCGEQVMGQFPACWKCGTTREGLPAPGGVSFPSAALGAASPPLASPSLSATPGLSTAPSPSFSPARPSPPLPPLSPVPQVGARSPQLDAAPRISTPGGGSLPGGALPPSFDVPPIPPVTGAEPGKPAANGESPSKSALPTSRTRTAEEEGLKIVIPPWDAASARTGRRASKSPTDADDRAARRAWWTAVAAGACAGIAILGGIVGGRATGVAVVGLICPPLLLYSIGVVLLLGLTGRELSRRGARFFYGALAVNALIIAAAFVSSGMHR